MIFSLVVRGDIQATELVYIDILLFLAGYVCYTIIANFVQHAQVLHFKRIILHGTVLMVVCGDIRDLISIGCYVYLEDKNNMICFYLAK